jgi:hypothetical protein
MAIDLKRKKMGWKFSVAAVLLRERIGSVM